MIEPLDLGRTTAVHIVGIGGAGMSAIASVLAGMGHQVSGSDLKDSPGLQRLRAKGVAIAVGHDGANVGSVACVAVSTAIPISNPEVVAARERGIPVLRRAELLAAIARTRRTVAVAGTHGKTTTSSMLALILREAGRQPSFIIGGDVNEIGTGAGWSTGDLLVVEADESDGTFLELPAEVAVVTSVEPDHLEHYGGFERLVDAFDRFIANATGGRVVCIDDAQSAALAARHNASTYGTAAQARYRIADVTADRMGSNFAVNGPDGLNVRLRLPVPGLHNVRNAAGALVTALTLGAPADAAQRALSRYAGVARRFEFRGEHGGISFVDDYAHLPSEVSAALEAAASGGWDRVMCVFQPHRFSRTAALWKDFADSFVRADELVVTDVYPAGEAPRPGVSGRSVADAVRAAHPDARVTYLAHRVELARHLLAELRPGDLCLTLGAGDLTSLPSELLDALGERG